MTERDYAFAGEKMDQSSLPEGDRIYDLYTGIYKPHIIRVVLAIDVFSPLLQSPAKAETVAKACKCDVDGIRRLLDYLVSLKVLEKQNEEYALSPDAAAFLVRGRKAYAGGLILHFTGTAPWEGLQESIRDGRPRVMSRRTCFYSTRCARFPRSADR
jgi:hypothetical protein